MQYHISYLDSSSRFIQVKWIVDAIHQDLLHLQLPAWRPGRYELQHFAKNIKDFIITDESGDIVAYQKLTKDRWEVRTTGIKKIIVSYAYYANQLDAGASYLCPDFLYLNPVNCLMYCEGRIDEACTLFLAVPENYQLATQMELLTPHSCLAHNFDHLADSPLIASASLQHHEFELDACRVHFWFQGKHPFDVLRLEQDTRLYAQAQINLFGELPCANYHFLYLMLDHPFRHGVEHLDSTVIAMGQLPDNTDEEYYQDLLAISSHEFFHLWNIKRIRPADMLPYDFTKENYSTLGYIYEGVTTYYGDLMLMRSDVWDWEQYANSLSADLKRHFENEGRFHYSVAESSWDTWLDGYVAGIPGRKVSIYMEGLIAACIADLIILKNSKGKYRLDDVLKELYQYDYKHHQGYTEQRYQQLLEQYGGLSFSSYFQQVIHGRGYMEKWLKEVLDWVGITLQVQSSKSTMQVQLLLKEAQLPVQKKLFSQWLNTIE